MNHKQFIHYIAFTLSVMVAVVCGVLVFHVNVNSDMTKYLPDNSPMKQGLDILASEFTAAQLQTADVKVMIPDVREERQYLADQLLRYDEVQNVTYQVSEDSAYTLYNLVVPKSVDQKSLGVDICDQLGDDIIVETSQDGATPPMIVIIIAAVLIFFILFLMAQSWIDPVIVMISAGLAVVINVGTNAFFPSVSITTNYIVAILQLVLSLDYSIILMNRYRQEQEKGAIKYLAINRAMKSAVRPILSSALTTIVGLLMLIFMRLKIGMDMGLVLAKGVVCSLICTFTVMPAILLWCTDKMNQWTKRTFVVPTDRLSRFATHHKVILSIFSLTLFVAAYFLSRKTEITFSTNGESQIAKVFPKTNPTLLLYDIQDEMNVITLADTLAHFKGVNNIISYPTLLKQQYTAEGLTEYVQELMTTMSDYMPPVEGIEMLTPDLMKVVYYQHSGASDTLRVPFIDMMKCIRHDCLENPMFSSVIDRRMRDQIQLLDMLMEASTQAEEEEIVIEKMLPTTTTFHTEPVQAASILPASKMDSTRKKKKVEMVIKEIPLTSFLAKLNNIEGSALTNELCRLTDVSRLNKEMNVRQMADFIGSSNAQTKMVYSFAGEGRRMTPIQYVHFLADDLFHRRGLSNMVSANQKEQLLLRQQLMDKALTNPSYSAADMVALLQPFGIDLTEEMVQQIAGGHYIKPIPSLPTEEVASAPTEPTNDVVEETETMSEASVAASAGKEDKRAELMDHLLTTNPRFTAKELAKQFSKLGEPIDVYTVTMLYSYYGSKYGYHDSLTMNAEQMLRYVADTLVRDSAVTKIVGRENCAQIQSLPTLIEQNIGMLSNDRHGLLIVLTDLPDESDETYQFIDSLRIVANNNLPHSYYMIGESVMFSEMKEGFGDEMKRITWFTILAIFLIVALSFRSLIVPSILVMTVMTAVFVNVIFSGLISGQMLYLAYLIVQSILMGATIDYGILYTNYYKEFRRTMDQYQAAQEAYHGAIRTIMTSGLIMIVSPGIMALLIDDVAISAIVGSLAIGAIVAIVLILVVLPGVLIAFDRWVVRKK